MIHRSPLSVLFLLCFPAKKLLGRAKGIKSAHWRQHSEGLKHVLALRYHGDACLTG